MIQLTLLGRIEVRRDDGSGIRSLPRSPKRLALLAYLATDGPGTFHRRDVVLSLLWPELDQAKARSALRSVLHLLRKDLGADVLVNRGQDEIGLDPDRISCDVLRFEEALAGERRRDALEIYGGDLLAGFFLPGAPDFERWLDTERVRLRRTAVEAAWAVAAEAEAEGNGLAAVRFARRAVALSPFDEAASARLIELLGRLGDRPGALAEYRRLARYLDEEFELEPSPEVAALAEAIEAAERNVLAVAVRPPPERAVGQPGVEAGPGSPPDALPAPAASSGPTAPTAPTGPSRRPLRMAAVLALAVLVGAAALRGLGWLGVASAPPAEPGAADVTTVALYPFTVLGAEDLAYLHEGLPRLLAHRLDVPGSVRPADPLVTLQQARRNPALIQSPERAAEAARSAGAGAWILGSVVQAVDSLRVSASLYRAGGQRPVTLEVDVASADAILPALDRVATRLVAELGPPGGELGRSAAGSTRSIAALRAYLGAEVAYQEGRFADAVAGFREAVAVDTSMALAYYGLSRAAEWLSDPALTRTAAEEASARADRLPLRVRLLLEAKQRNWASQHPEGERLLRSVLVRYPDDIEATWELMEMIFHGGPADGRPITGAEGGYRAVLRQDPDHAAARHHLARLTSLRGGLTEAETLARPLLEVPEDRRNAELLALRAVWRGQREAWSEALDRLAALDSVELAVTLWRAAIFAPDPFLASPAVEIVLDATRPLELQAFGYYLRAEIEAGGGRLGSALDRAAWASARSPWIGWSARALLALVPEFEAVHPLADDVVRDGLALHGTDPDRAASVPGGRVPAYAVRRLSHPAYTLAYLGFHAALQDDRAAVAEVRRSLVGLPSPWDTGVEELVDAAEAYRAGGASAALERLGPPEPYASRRLVTAWILPFWTGELLLEADRGEEALDWYASVVQDEAPGVALRAVTHLRRARILATLERHGEAATEYRRVLTLWQRPGPELAPVVRQARKELAALPVSHSRPSEDAR